MGTCSTINCRKPAKTIVLGKPYCGNHGRYLRDAADRQASLMADLLADLTEKYVPEMRRQETAMLRRMVDTVTLLDERPEMQVHLLARQAAARLVVEERDDALAAVG